MTRYFCRSCSADYPEEGLPHLCPHCGGIFTVEAIRYVPNEFAQAQDETWWRYRSAFALPERVQRCWLGEGDTPLVERTIDGLQFFFKSEHLNPSGSFKDRQSAVLVSLLKARGIPEVIEDSSGNAGASLSQYANAFGVKSTIFIPASTSGPKRQQIEDCGANVMSIPGGRQNAAQAVMAYFKEQKVPYASHALLPFGLAAYATISFEIYESLKRMPAWVIAPIGHGSLFLGLLLGFEAIAQHTGFKRPRMLGVQTENCSSVYRAWKGLPAQASNPSIAEGVMVEKPARGDEILSKLKDGFDELVTVDDEEILLAYKSLAGMGFYVEPSSAMVWAAKNKGYVEKKDDCVLILSGNGLKSIRKK